MAPAVFLVFQSIMASERPNPPNPTSKLVVSGFKGCERLDGHLNDTRILEFRF